MPLLRHHLEQEYPHQTSSTRESRGNPDGISNSACFNFFSGEITLPRITCVLLVIDPLGIDPQVLNSIVTPSNNNYLNTPEIRSRVEKQPEYMREYTPSHLLSCTVHSVRPSLPNRIILPTGLPDPRTHPPPVLISHLISSHFFSILRCIAYSAQRKERIESCKDRYPTCSFHFLQYLSAPHLVLPFLRSHSPRHSLSPPRPASILRLSSSHPPLPLS